MSTQSILIIIIAVLASLLEIIDTSIVNVAIPTMMGNLGVTLDEISWVSTAYMIANSIILPVAAWFGARMGRKQYFTGAILLFTLSSLACGLAPNLPILILFRVIQGLAGGALLPTSQTLIQEQFPKEKATLAMAIFGMGVMVGPALGPVIGGYLTDNLGWRSIFNVNVPIGLIASLLSYLYVDQVKSNTDLQTETLSARSKIDWGGFALLSLGVGCFQFILERGQTEGWMDSNAIRVTAFLAMIGVVGFIFWELHVSHPIMNLRLFKSNVVRAGAILMLALGLMLYALTFVVPIFVNNIIHMTATQTGKLFIPGSIATAFSMMAVGVLSKYLHPRSIIITGIILATTALFMMSQFTTQTGAQDLIVPLIIRGVATGLLFIPISGVVMGQFRGEQLEQVAGIMSFFRQTGGSIGIAALSTLLTRLGKQNYVDLMPKLSVLTRSGYHDFTSIAAGVSSASLKGSIGMGDPQTLAIKSMWGRVMQQTFIMSFNQLCWIILFIVVGMTVPVFMMKMQKRVNTQVSAH